MEKINYKKINFRCGIEIHRQMSTHKLFCSCNSTLSNDVQMKIKRKLIPTTSELEEIDKVAKFEMGKNKYAIYEYSPEYSCLIELDEQPINQINEDALDTALIVSQMLNCNIIDEIQIMRKQVLDYSNTSSFQRTALIALDGYIKTSKGKIGIQTVCLEEDAARKIKDEKDYVIYRLDRLGIPLIEIATAPDIKTPEQAKEVAEFLGMLLKSTNRFKSGIGTIRQDLNLSIKNFPRVELKGVQDLRKIPTIIEKEIKRQLDLIKQNKKLKEEVRKVLPDCSSEFLRPLPGKARLYVETDHPPIKITQQRLNQLEIPELITDRAINFERKYGISPQIAREIIKENVPFDYYAEKYKLDPNLIAYILIKIPKDIKTRYNIKKEPTKKDFEFIFKNIQSNKITKDAAYEILLNLIQNKKTNLNKYKIKDTKKVEQEIKKIVEKNKGASFNAIMGEVMKIYKGKMDNKFIVSMVKKYM